jgi:hypothetical protein
MRFSGILDLRSLKVANIFGDLEPAKSRSREHAKIWDLEPAKSRISEDGKFGNPSEVKFGSRERGDSRAVRSKVKVVVPKSPGLECELVASFVCVHIRNIP